MTEAEWLAGITPDELLRGLPTTPGERKLRLFALAGCGHIDHFITDPRSRAALAFVEQHAETTPNRKKGRPGIEKAAYAAWSDAYGRHFSNPENQRTAALVASNAADAAHSALAL